MNNTSKYTEIIRLIEAGFGISDVANITHVPNYVIRVIVGSYTKNGYERTKLDDV